ncbi:hypothetical protein [Neobacillus sp. OS1-33]|nr:hypothetical protein [Neobacillus sp. OS1-33]WML24114.1 hypothetical protein RCG22_14225 [Neobacillus sp. OS1-33]
MGECFANEQAIFQAEPPSHGLQHEADGSGEDVNRLMLEQCRTSG